MTKIFKIKVRTLTLGHPVLCTQQGLQGQPDRSDFSNRSKWLWPVKWPVMTSEVKQMVSYPYCLPKRQKTLKNLQTWEISGNDTISLQEHQILENKHWNCGNYFIFWRQNWFDFEDNIWLVITIVRYLGPVSNFFWNWLSGQNRDHCNPRVSLTLQIS